MKSCVDFWLYLAQFFLEWEMFQTKVVEKIKTHILCSVNVFLKSRCLRDNVENLGTAGQATNLHLWSYLDEFYLEREMFQTKFVEKINTHISCSVNVFLKSRRLRDNVENLGTAGQATNLHLWSYLDEFYLEREMFQTKVVEKINTLILCLVNVFLKLRRLRDNVENLGTARQATNKHFLSYLDEFYTEREMFQTKVVEKIKTHILCSVNVFLKSRRLRDNMGKMSYFWLGHRSQYGACALHAGYLRPQTHTHNTCYSLLFHYNKWFH